MLNHPNGPLRSVERPTADVLAVLHYDGGVQVNVCFWSIASSRRLGKLRKTIAAPADARYTCMQSRTRRG